LNAGAKYVVLRLSVAKCGIVKYAIKEVVGKIPFSSAIFSLIRIVTGFKPDMV